MTFKDADRGQAAFTRTGLALYDVLILRALCPWVWRCPNERILTAYRQHLSDNHLEVGVGTGYFLDHARFSNASPRVALLDLNVHCLARTDAQFPQQVELVAPPVEVCAPVWSTLSVAHCVSLAWVPMAVAVIR